MTERHPRIPPRVRFVAADEGTVLRELSRGRYQRPNDSGVSIWSDIGASTVCAGDPGVREVLLRRRGRGGATLEPAP